MGFHMRVQGFVVSLPLLQEVFLWVFRFPIFFKKFSNPDSLRNAHNYVDVVVNFLFQLIFLFPLFWGMVMYANEFKTKEKQKLTEIKN